MNKSIEQRSAVIAEGWTGVGVYLEFVRGFGILNQTHEEKKITLKLAETLRAIQIWTNYPLKENWKQAGMYQKI